MTSDSHLAESPAPRAAWHDSPFAAVVAIWASAAAIALAAPDLVSGSEHEHLPLAMMTVWLWAAVGTTYALMTPRRAPLTGWVLAVAAVWALTALVSVLAPEMVTGTDPTRIPLAALIGPPVAAVVTGMLSLRQANLPP